MAPFMCPPILRPPAPPLRLPLPTRRNKLVDEMWRVVSRNPAPNTIGISTLYARSLLMACDQPLLHPYTQLRIYETFAESIGIDPAGTPPEERTVVVTLPRNDGTQRNGGRGCGAGSRALGVTKHACMGVPP